MTPARHRQADPPSENSVLRQENAELRQEVAKLRQEASDVCREAANLNEQAAQAQANIHSRTEGRLREANTSLVLAGIRAQSLTEAAEESTVRMTYMAEHDFLTGLPNRSLLTARLTQSIALAQRHDQRVAVLYMDLDRFKHINDSLGHAVGDRLLQAVAQRLQTCVRVSDTVCRQGGDEFLIVLAVVAGLHDAETAAEKLIKAMAAPFMIDQNRLHLTLSIGISIYPDDGKDAQTLVRNADNAMYHAKRSGRNTYQAFTAQMNVHAMARRSIEQALHEALEAQQFVLHYQPQVNLQTGAIDGAEALVRIQRSAPPLLFPNHFVRIAEDCGLIIPIGKWVIHEACRQTQEWLDDGLEVGQISVNVSTRELYGKDFLANVDAILTSTGLDPGRLEIELTESGLMYDTENTTQILRALKTFGVRLAIDDFGTGYSSLSYLRHFPIDTVKIDQSFVLDIVGENNDAPLVRAIIAMGKSLKLQVVAEGIETRQQLAFLQSLECTEGQGYYFSRPLPAEEFAVLLEPGRRGHSTGT
ncbi:MAG: EAL domain-containing protein [Propionivibrio sp.]